MSDLLEKTVSELDKELVEARTELRELRFKNSEGQLREVRKIRTLRTRIAQLETARAKKANLPATA